MSNDAAVVVVVVVVVSAASSHPAAAGVAAGVFGVAVGAAKAIVMTALLPADAGRGPRMLPLMELRRRNVAVVVSMEAPSTDGVLD